MNNYDRFMWWSIQNKLNIFQVLDWYLTKRIKIKYINSDYKRSNKAIRKWLLKRLCEYCYIKS
jgi:hypothetical protein